MNKLNYSLAILTSFEKNKNTSAIARELNEEQRKISRELKKFDISMLTFEPLIQNVFGNKELIFGIDETTLMKRYAKLIEGVESMFDQSTKTFANCYNILAGCLTDGKYLIPIDLEQWVSKIIMGNKYLTKTDLAELIVKKAIEAKLNIKYFVFDGLYSTEKFMKFLNDLHCKFVMKIRNTTKIEVNGEMVKLTNCKQLKLNSNQRQKTVKALWKGGEWYFTALKRSGKNGEKIIYLVANFKTKSRIYKKIYDARWGVEKLFRTGKQYLGISASSSRSSNVYLNHIKCSFLAYGILQVIRKKFRLKSSEEALRKIQALKLWQVNAYNSLLDSFITSFA